MSPFRLIAVSVLALASIAAEGGNRTLQTPTRFDAGNSTALTTIFAGDFTADGKKDVLVSETGKIRVLAGGANGTFAAAVVSDCADYVPEGLADFNTDGRPDLYLVDDDGKIAVMLGAANGSFGAPAEVSSPVAAGELVAGDFTGDAVIDLAMVTDVYDQIVVFTGNGSGGFSSTHTSAITLSETIADATSGDFDGDGKRDIAAVGLAGSVIAWNSGGGTAFLPEALSALEGVAAVSGDVNGDGIADIVASGSSSPGVSPGKSIRGLTVQLLADVPVGTHLAIAPMDADSRPDIITSNTNVTVVTFDGTAFHPRSFSAGDLSVGIAAADFTGDGKKDVVALTGGSISLLGGNGDGTLRSHIVWDPAGALGLVDYGSRLFVGNVNGDANLDLVAFDYSSDGRIGVVPGLGNGTFGAPIWTNVAASAGQPYDAGDLNGDGRMDLLLWTSDVPTATFQVLFSQVNGTFTPGPTQSYANSASAVDPFAIRDFTGDGNADIIDKKGRFLRGLGGGTFAPPVTSGLDLELESRVVNVNGDAFPDVLVQWGNPTWTFLNHGDGTFSEKTPEVWTYDLHTTGDFNGDGFDDLITGDILLGNGTGDFTYLPFHIDVRRDSLAVAAVDVDGDGKNDVASSTAIYFGSGDGRFDAAVQTAFGNAASPPARILSTGDFDHNGSPDLWLWDVNRDVLTIIPTRIGASGTAASQIAVSASPNPSAFPAHYGTTATVTGDTVKPRGAILYTHGSELPSSLLCTNTSGTAIDVHGTFPVDSTTTITASFLGDEHYAPSSGTTEHTVIRGKAKLTLTTSRTTHPFGQAADVSAYLRSEPGWSPTPTGTVNFYDNGVTIRSAPAEAYQRILTNTPPAFAVGTHNVTADYTGDANYEPAVSAPVQIVVTKRKPTIALSLSATTVTPADNVTLTANIGSYLGVTGTIAFSCFGQPLGTMAIVDQHAALTTQLPWGSGTCTASYAETTDFAAATGASGTVLVSYGSMPTAPLVDATRGASPFEVALRISPITGATAYDLYRSVDGAPMTLRTTFSTLQSLTDTMPSGSKVGVYAVVARNSGGQTTPMGARDLVSLATFTNDPIAASSTKVQALHIVELQNAINAVRVAAGLAPATFTTPADAISAAQIASLRTALTQARAALGLATSFTDPTLTPGVTPIRAVHLQQLRDGVK
jgi:hypothetical protein